MKILILAAMDKELNLLINLLEDIEERKFNTFEIKQGRYLDHDLLLAKCGIGKVNAALNSYQIIKETNPDLILNSGVAGGAGIPIGSILIADKIAYHDVWCGPGTLYGQADSFPLYMTPSSSVLNLWKELQHIDKINKGLICSGDKFITTPEEISLIRSHFPEVKAVDMESAAIAQTCILMDKPFAVIRIVSDTPGEGENISQYKDFWNKAPEKTFEVLNEILKRIQ